MKKISKNSAVKSALASDAIDRRLHGKPGFVGADLTVIGSLTKSGKKSLKHESAAIITIRKPGLMNDAGRKAIAGWLRQHADDLVKYGKGYTNTTFIGRFMYPKKKK